jgi:hypothetical protein
MNGIRGWKKKPFWIRLLHWEYWSFNLIYIPIYPVFIFLCLRARSFFFYAAANPGIKNGGFLGESKKELYRLIPGNLQPKTIFFSAGTNPALALVQASSAGMYFPLIGKPDIGGRGRWVKKLDNESDLLAYVSVSPIDFHIQEFINYENEDGIFYYRLPGQNHGNISGVVHKEFLKVTGDGLRNVRELLRSNPRGILQLDQLEQTDRSKLEYIPGRGEKFTVVPYGNHARGALFLDDSASISPALVKAMDNICSDIPGFYFGRLDIRYESRELLEQGKLFSVLEVNGAGSEPTHIYDPRHSLFFAWKEIIRHWIILFNISRVNHRLGHRYLTVRAGIRMFRKDTSDSKKLASVQTKSI